VSNPPGSPKKRFVEMEWPAFLWLLTKEEFLDASHMLTAFEKASV